MRAVILAGGLGTRLKPLTAVIPKPLLPVGEQSVLEITIKRLYVHNFKDIIIATYYKPQFFEAYLGNGSQWGVNITYSKERERLGTAGPLKLIENMLTEPFLVINGDILTNLDFSKLVAFHKRRSADLVAVTKVIQMPLHYGVIESQNGVITMLREKPTVESEVLAGIYYLNPEVLEFIPSNEYFDMTGLIRLLIHKRKTVLRYVLNDYWLDIGQLKDYEQAQVDFNNGAIQGLGE